MTIFRRNLDAEQSKILHDWFNDHKEWPYPKGDERKQLCEQVGITNAQLSNWFINARCRAPVKTWIKTNPHQKKK